MVLVTPNRSQTRSAQWMLPRNHPDHIQIAFDDTRLVGNAGLILPATLARYLPANRNVPQTRARPASERLLLRPVSRWGAPHDPSQPLSGTNCPKSTGQSLLHVPYPPFRHRHHPVRWIWAHGADWLLRTHGSLYPTHRKWFLELAMNAGVSYAIGTRNFRALVPLVLRPYGRRFDCIASLGGRRENPRRCERTAWYRSELPPSRRFGKGR